jgi:PDZ domain-containing protein
MRRPSRGWRIAGWAVVGLVAATVISGIFLWRWPSDTYLLLPDHPHPAASVVTVPHAKPDTNGGGIYFVDVIERKASVLEDTFRQIAPDGASFVPPADVQPPGASESQTQTFELQEMATSQQIAAAVALRAAGYKVDVSADGALIVAVDSTRPAGGKLVPGDVIVSVDGHPVKTTDEARGRLRRHKPGDTVELGVRNQQGLRTVRLKTVADPQDPKIPIVGVLLEQAAHIKLPFRVTINSGKIGGPSAGLPFALEVLQKLGRDVDRGRRVAATGEIFLDGAVGPIGGVKQKTIGARQAGVDIFLVPAGDNYREAKKYAGPMRVIPVNSFQQALHALATLPPKR